MRLPRGWSEVPIEDVLAPLKDGRPIHQGWSPQCEKEPSQSDDAWGVLKTTAIQAGEFHPEHNKLLPTKLEPRPLIEVHEGDLLLTCAGPRARCGVPCLVRSTRPHLMLSGKMYRFRTPEEHLSARYLESFLRSRDAQVAINRMKTGISDSGLNLTQKRFKQLAVPIAPRLEQERIVEAIESYLTRLDDAVASLERVQRNLERYRASVLKAAVEGRLVPTEAELARREGRAYEPSSELLERILAERKKRWIEDAAEKARAKGNGNASAFLEARKQAEKKYKEPEPPDTTNLPDLPEGWCWTTVDCVCDVQGGLAKGKHRKPTDVLREVPYLRVANVQRGWLELAEIKTIPATEDEISKLTLQRGDVLFNEGGDRDKLGRGWIWEGQVAECIHQNHVFRARIIDAAIRPRLLSWYGNTKGQDYFFGQGKQTTNLASISLTRLRALPIPLPPLDEQSRIQLEAERLLSSIDAITSQVAASRARSGRMRQSILKWAFEGKLVEQDPNDEPASALLERIKAETARVKS